MPHVIFYFFTLQILTWENSEPHQWKKPQCFKTLSDEHNYVCNCKIFLSPPRLLCGWTPESTNK